MACAMATAAPSLRTNPSASSPPDSSPAPHAEKAKLATGQCGRAAVLQLGHHASLTRLRHAFDGPSPGRRASGVAYSVHLTPAPSVTCSHGTRGGWPRCLHSLALPTFAGCELGQLARRVAQHLLPPLPVRRQSLRVAPPPRAACERGRSMGRGCNQRPARGRQPRRAALPAAQATFMAPAPPPTPRPSAQRQA